MLDEIAMATPVEHEDFGSVTDSIMSIVCSGASYLADLIGRLLRGIGVSALIASCQSPVDPAVKPTPSPVQEVVAPADAAPKKDEGPKALGKFDITFYYVVGEEELSAPKKPKTLAASVPSTVGAPANDNQAPDLASIAPDKVTLYTGTCQPISEVTREFADQLTIQGTGKLRDGRVVNVWGRCNCEHSPCFKVTPTPWGTAGTGNLLQPFRTVAVDPRKVKLGSLLYVPLLEGRMMPGREPWGGFVHDGCVVADDVGAGIRGDRLDLFVGRRGWFLGMSGNEGSHSWARHVPVFDGSKLCERKGRQVTRRAGAI